MLKLRSLLFSLLLLTPNLLFADHPEHTKVEPLVIRMPIQSGTSPFTLQAHVFSRDPLAESLQIVVEGGSFYRSSSFPQQTLTIYRLKEQLGPGNYTFTVTVSGGPENKVLHQRRVTVTVIGPGSNPEE